MTDEVSMKKRIVFAGNGRHALRILQLLLEEEQIVAVLLHPEYDERYRRSLADEMRALADQRGNILVLERDPNDSQYLEQLRAKDPEFLVNVGCGYIYHSEMLSIPCVSAINLHTSLLPLHRGRNTAAWTLIEGTSAGVTIHLMTKHIDCGGILAQQRVTYSDKDDVLILRSRLEDASVELFTNTWIRIRSNELIPQQQKGPGCYHTNRDLRAMVQELQSVPDAAAQALLRRIGGGRDQ